MLISKDQWLAWKLNPVTKALAGAINQKISDGIAAIISSDNPSFDRMAKGKIYGYKDILEWVPDIEGESTEDGNVSREFSRKSVDLEALDREDN
jgi:hypothetical protein